MSNTMSAPNIAGAGLSGPSAPQQTQPAPSGAQAASHAPAAVQQQEAQARAQQVVTDFYRLLKTLLTDGVSDLHFVGDENAWAVKFGRTVKSEHPVTNIDVLNWAQVLGASKGGANFLRNDPSGTLELMSVVGELRLRMTFRRQSSGYGLTVRVVPDTPPSLEDAVFARNPIPQALIDLTLNTTSGLILGEGPTGSGKTTLLAALINEVNKTQSKHIFTAEDPIEFVHKSKMSVVTQVEIGDHTNSFPRALRTSLRSRPNVILVGELLDLETVRGAIEAANKGHLVFATSHASSAEEGVSSLVSQFPGSEQNQIQTALSQALAAVVVQRLIPTIDGRMVPARELLLSTTAIRNKVKNGEFTALSQALKPADGMWSFEDDLAKLWAQEQITEEACIRYCNDLQVMRQKLEYAAANREGAARRLG